MGEILPKRCGNATKLVILHAFVGEESGVSVILDRFVLALYATSDPLLGIVNIACLPFLWMTASMPFVCVLLLCGHRTKYLGCLCKNTTTCIASFFRFLERRSDQI